MPSDPGGDTSQIPSHDQLVDIWGHDGVVITPAENLVGAVLPATARQILTTVGLPRRANIWFSLRQANHPNEHYQLGLGWHDRYIIYIDRDSGRVMSRRFDPSPGPAEYVNADLATFLTFLMRCELLASAVEAAEGESLADFAADTRQQLIDLDPATAKDNAWWATTLEDMVTMID